MRGQRGRAAVAGFGLCPALQIIQHIAQTEPQLRMLRRGCHRLTQTSFGLGQLSGALRLLAALQEGGNRCIHRAAVYTVEIHSTEPQSDRHARHHLH